MKIKFGEGELKVSSKGQITDMFFKGESVFPKGQLSWLLRVFRNGKEEQISNVEQENEELIFHWKGLEDVLKMQVTEKKDIPFFRLQSVRQLLIFWK